MKTVKEHIWGPGVTPESRTLLAAAGTELPNDEYAHIVALAEEAEAQAEEQDSGPLSLSIGNLTEHLETVDDVDELAAMAQAEEAGQNRKGALSAIAARSAVLAGD